MADAALNFDTNINPRGIEQGVANAWNSAQRYINSKPLQLKVAGGGNDFAKLNASAKQFNSTLDSVTRRVSSFAAAGAVFLTVDKFFKNLVTSTIDVDEALTKINVNLGQTTEGLKQFGQQIFDISRITGTSFKEAAKAAEELARQGLSAEETGKRLKESLLLARIAGIDTTEAVEGLTAAINSFSREALSGYEIINKLAAVDTRFAVSSKDLTEGISRAGAAAQDAGVSFDQLLAIITSVQQTTQRGGAVIGNALKTIFTRVSRPEVLEQIQQLGIAVKDTSGAFLPAIQILQNVASKYDDLSQVQKAFLTEQVGSVFQINVLKAALRDLSKENGTYAQALTTSSNARDEAIRKNDELNKSLRSSITATENSLSQFFSSLGNQGISPILKGVLDGIDSARKYLSGGAGNELGQFLGDGIIKGISNVLTGPAFFGAVFVIGKTVGRILTALTDSTKSLLQQNGATENRAAILGRINTLLAEANSAEQANIKAAITELQLKEAILAVSQRIAATEASRSIAVSENLIGSLGTTFRGRGAATGYLPALANEGAAIRAGVGGASASAKPVAIGNFAYGGGVTGPIVANSDEYMVKNYAGGGSAIFNPAMIAARGLPPGATKIGSAAGGFIPNAAFGTTPGFDIGLRSARGASISSADTNALTKLFEAVKKAGSGSEARDLGKGIIDITEGLNKASQSHVLEKLGQVYSSFDNGSRLAARAGVARLGGGSRGESNEDHQTRINAILGANRDQDGLTVDESQALDARIASLRKSAGRGRTGYDTTIGPKRPGLGSRLASRASGLVNRVNPLALAFAAPIAAGFLPEGRSGTGAGAALGAASGALNGAGIGAVFGPAGVGLGAAVGALVGAFSKASRSVEEFSKDVDENSAKQKEGADAFSRASTALDNLNEARKGGASQEILDKLTASFAEARGQVNNPRLLGALNQNSESRAKTLENEQAQVQRQARVGEAAKAFEATRGRSFAGDDLGGKEVQDAISKLSAALTKEQAQALSSPSSRARLNTISQGNFNFADEESIKTAKDLEDTFRGLGGAFADANVHIVDASKSAYILSSAATKAALNFRGAAETASKAAATVGKIALNPDAFASRNPQTESALAGISARRFGRQNPFDIARTNLAGLNALADVSPESKKLFQDETSKDPRAIEYQRNLRISQQGNLLDAAGAFVQSRNPAFRIRNESGGYNQQSITTAIDRLTKDANRSVVAAALDLKERLIQAANGVANVGGYGLQGVSNGPQGKDVPYVNGEKFIQNGVGNSVAGPGNYLQRGGGRLPTDDNRILINGIQNASTQFKQGVDQLAQTKLKAENTFNVNVVIDPKLALVANQEAIANITSFFTQQISALNLRLGKLEPVPAPPSSALDQRRQALNFARQNELDR